MTLHPATRLAAWIVLAAGMPWLSMTALAWMAAVVIPACALYRDVPWRRYLRRSSVLLLSMILIYGFATPGHPMLEGWAVSPTYEGFEAGLLQAARLVLLLLALALVLSNLRREPLLAGVYCLLRPLRCLGLPVERLALRLWLTLHYADAAPTAGPLMARLEAVAGPEPSEFVLPLPAFRMLDALFLLGVIAALVWGFA